MKDIIIKELQGDNERLRMRCSHLENKLASLKTSTNPLEQYGRRNNLVLRGIPDTIVHDELESRVTSGLNLKLNLQTLKMGIELESLTKVKNIYLFSKQKVLQKSIIK